jgi:hypothetical protein
MARGCDLGFGWLAKQPASKPVGHTRHSSHADHTMVNPKVTEPRTNLSGTLSDHPRRLPVLGNFSPGSLRRSQTQNRGKHSQMFTSERFGEKLSSPCEIPVCVSAATDLEDIL